MSTKAKLLKTAAKFGATIEDDSSGIYVDVVATAPQGLTWKCDPGLHQLVGAQYKGPWGRKDLYDDLIDRMENGVEPCIFGEECEWCNNIEPE